MEMLYCQNCKKTTGHKRAIGIGTLLGGVATLGVSLIAIPFYPLRCVKCGAKLPDVDDLSLENDILSNKFKLEQLHRITSNKRLPLNRSRIDSVFDFS
jgi:hypothetical protein